MVRVLLCAVLCMVALVVHAQLMPEHVYRGVIHIHSVYSDGGGTFPEIIAAAQDVGLDFIITSDHNTLQPLLDGFEGWHDNLLTLVGVEISTDVGHYLAIRVPGDFVWPGRDGQGVIDAVREAGGLGFIAHPVERWEWRDWSVTGFTGLEIANQSSLVHQSFEVAPLRVAGRALQDILRSSSIRVLDRAYRARPSGALDTWMEEILRRQRPLVAIGSADAHALVEAGRLRLRLPTYQQSFSSMQTHVILPAPFTGELAQDREALYAAIARGHCYIMYAIRGQALGFHFRGYNGRDDAIMGDTLPLYRGVTLEAVLPPHQQPTVIRLYRNGHQIANTLDDMLTREITEPGVYHIEVYLLVGNDRWPWIVSNPIYVMGDDGPGWGAPGLEDHESAIR